MRNTRKAALGKIRVAGYHGDKATATGAYLDARVSFDAFRIAYREGERLRAAGMRCECLECKEKFT
jgi:cytidylate kinase